MNSAPLPEHDERRRMAARLWVAWTWLLALTLTSAPVLHGLGLEGALLVLCPALGGLLLTCVVVLHARRPGLEGVQVAALSDPASPHVQPAAA